MIVKTKKQQFVTFLSKNNKEVNAMLRLKDLREEKGVLQKELAHAINRTRACISSWEQGKTEPSIDDLLKLADFFEVTIDCLVGRDGHFVRSIDKDDSKELEVTLISCFRRLPEHEQYRTVGFAQALATTPEKA